MRILVDLQGAQSESRFRGIGRLSRSMAKAILRQNSEHTISILFNGALTDNIEDLKADFNSLLPREQMLTFHIPAPTAGFAPENAWRARASELVRETYIAQQRPDMVYITSVFEGFSGRCHNLDRTT